MKRFFRGFNCQKWEGQERITNCQISLFGLQNIAKNNRKMIKDYYTTETCQ